MARFGVFVIAFAAAVAGANPAAVPTYHTVAGILLAAFFATIASTL